MDTVPASLALAQAANGSAWGTARFDDVDASVQYYMLTLNSHPAYQDLRNIRFDARNNNEPVRGVDLANGLLSYSERREAYVEEIQAMIRTNNLQRFSRRTQ